MMPHDKIADKNGSVVHDHDLAIYNKNRLFAGRCVAVWRAIAKEKSHEIIDNIALNNLSGEIRNSLVVNNLKPGSRRDYAINDGKEQK